MLRPPRHCERSEAIQNPSVEKVWIRSARKDALGVRYDEGTHVLSHDDTRVKSSFTIAVDQMFTASLQQPFTTTCDRPVKTPAFA